MVPMNRREFVKAGVSTVAGLAGIGKSALGETSGPQPGRNRPNILLLYSDQHNGRVLRCAGHSEVITPNIDRLAREGVYFPRTYCQDGVCVPSRTSMLTGQYCRTTGVLHNPDKPSQPERLRMWPKLLQSQGYKTAAFGKRHLPPSLDDGFDITCTTLQPKNEPSDEYYHDWVRDQGQYSEFQRDWNAEFGHRLPGNQAAPMAALISKLKPDNTMEAYTAMKTVEFLRSAKKTNKPFFCWTSFYRPHQPYTPLPDYVKQYDLDKLILPETLGEPIENLPPMLRNWRRNENKPWCLAKAARDIDLYRRYIGYYYALVTEIDHHIGVILKVLKEERLMDNTIVIYTSDHGDFVGAHGMIEKCAQGHNIYEDTLRIPLIICWPGHTKTGLVADGLAETVDIYPTLLDLAEINPPDGYHLPGKSLVSVLTEGRSLGRQFAISENWSQLTAISERYKLGIWLKPQQDYGDMLFDVQADPLETKNLTGRPEVAKIEKQMRDFLEDWSVRTPFVPPIGKGIKS